MIERRLHPPQITNVAASRLCTALAEAAAFNCRVIHWMVSASVARARCLSRGMSCSFLATIRLQAISPVSLRPLSSSPAGATLPSETFLKDPLNPRPPNIHTFVNIHRIRIPALTLIYNNLRKSVTNLIQGNGNSTPKLKLKPAGITLDPRGYHHH